MDLMKILGIAAAVVVGLWLLSFIFRVLIGVVALAFPLLILAVVVYVIARALGLVKP